ncbi:MAG: glycosyltransferase involved in cell wall biosynthesis [Arenicella sp.]|jgi:glycosyltransferase involved in cell wall biosynthesis
MKVLFLTNMPSYHQMELARRLAELLGDANFRIVFYKPTSNSRTEMGWDDSYSDSFVLRFWQSEHTRTEIRHWISNADVVIHGRFPIAHVRKRINSGKLTFAYQERYFKRKFSYLKVMFRSHRIIKNYWSVNRPNYHLLAAGAYTASDLNRIGMFHGRSWKFGYFIEPSDTINKNISGSELTLLWCARFSPVKQPQQVLEIARGLQQRKVRFKLTMVGDGELRAQTERAVTVYGLSDQIKILGWQTPEQVKALMRSADIFLMTSHQGEGWGIVVNEAMSNGCATVVNRAVGSAPWLIQHGKTGLIYEDEHLEKLLDEITNLSQQQLNTIGRAGYQHMVDTWSCQAAAKRFVSLAGHLLDQQNKDASNGHSIDTPFASGPCSPAT